MVFILVFLQSMSELYLPTLMADIVDIGIVQGDIPYIWKIGGFMLIIAILGTIVSILASYLAAKVSMGFGKLLRNKVFTHVSNFSLQEFDKIGTASLITRTTNDITQVQNVTMMMLRMMIMAPLMCIGGVIMAMSRDVELSVIFVVAVPILAAVIVLVASKGIPLFKAMQKKVDKLNLVLREQLTGVRVVRSFNRTNHEHERFDEANRDLTGTALKVNRLMAVMMPIMMLMINFTTIAIIWFGGIRIDQGDMLVGDLMAFIQYAMQIMFSLMMMTMMFVMIPRASVSAARINEVIQMKPEILDAEDVMHTDNNLGVVEFRDVTFSYPGAEQPAVHNISFTAEPGKVTAIIGGTGSGKSTLINLIPRFYDVDTGAVLVDGIDVREFSQEELRSKIGYVPQKALLFTGTIADNIRYGKEQASIEEVEHAAKVAQATEFISNMNDAFDTMIAQGGANVSGGQKQRLSIARALVRKAKIYLFDDSFSALDFKTDAKLRAALKEETDQATILIVAQRVSTVMDADQIIVMDEGKIVGIGKHRELLSTCEVYREIVTSQLSEEEIA